MSGTVPMGSTRSIRSDLRPIRRISAAGKPAGFLTLDQDFLAEIVDAGSIFTAVDVDAAILRKGALERARTWRARTG